MFYKKYLSSGNPPSLDKGKNEGVGEGYTSRS